MVLPPILFFDLLQGLIKPVVSSVLNVYPHARVKVVDQLMCIPEFSPLLKGGDNSDHVSVLVEVEQVISIGKIAINANALDFFSKM